MAEVSGNDLTVIYYTANVISDHFARQIQSTLLHAIAGRPLISVSLKPLEGFGYNYVLDLPHHHLSIYKQALEGAKHAKTKYIALTEDDVLYSPEHFKYRPSPGKFAYNMNAWNIFTWESEAFTQKLGGRKNLNGLICERELFIEAMTERFVKFPGYEGTPLKYWAEPGKYEKYLGVTVRETEEFTTNPPNIIFSHETALSFDNLGTRKRLGEVRALKIPGWGTAKQVMEVYSV